MNRTMVDYQSAYYHTQGYTYPPFHQSWMKHAVRLKKLQASTEDASVTCLVVRRTWNNYPTTNVYTDTVIGTQTFTVAAGDTYSDRHISSAPAAPAPGTAVGTYFLPLTVKIDEVSFGGTKYWELKSDNGATTYSAPHWKDTDGDGTATTNTSNGEKNYPVAFTRNTQPQVGAKITITGLPNGQTLKIKASSAQGLQIPETSVTSAANGKVTLPLTTATNNLANTIRFYNADDNSAFEIDWEISIDSNGWSPIGSTKHTVYVTMADPITTAAGLMRETLFNLGCRNANGLGTTEQAVVDAIYDDFKDRDVQRVQPSRGTLDGSGMTYWNHPLSDYHLTTDLLSTGDGKCGAWNQLFTDVLRSQGIDAQIMIFYAPMPDIQTLGTAIQAQYPNYQGQITLLFGPNNSVPQPRIMVKNWNIGNVFAPIDNQGVAAQGNSDPQANFTDHSVVEYGGKYYDPSYGSNVYTSQQNWEDTALDGFGFVILANPPLPDQPQINPTLGAAGATIWIWQPDPKGSVETISQPFNY